jgi:hypothetical protein
MHSPCNTFFSLHIPICFLLFHLHAHLALKEEEEPFKVQELGLGLNLLKNPTKKLSKFNVSMKVWHIKTILATQRRKR